jgi:hypothetical protein
VSADGAESAAQRSAGKLDQPGYPQESGEVGRLRVSEVVAGAAGAHTVCTTPVRDAASRISDTRVRCMPAVAKRGRTRLVALVTTERPVHVRTLPRAVRATARRLVMQGMFVEDRVMAMRNR